MARFFVSYSRSVKDEVRKVIELLSAGGHEVWWDGDIPVMADWWATILSHIEWCEVFIFVASEKSVQSAYCLAELKYAADRQRPIVPFILGDPTALALPSELPSRGQWLLYNGDPAQMLSQINIASDQIDWQLHKDINVPRPPEPLTGGKSLARQFQEARQLADNLEFDAAKQMFTNVKRLDYGEWGPDCDEWLARLTSYATIIELVDDPATRDRAARDWQTHIREYGDSFDPYTIKNKLSLAPKPVRKMPRPGRATILVAVFLMLLALVVIILNGLKAGTPAPAVAGVTTPDLTRTLDAMDTSILGTNIANETVTAAAFTATPTPTDTPTTTDTPDIAQTLAAQNTEAAVIAANFLATQQAQLIANAPTDTPQPTATATETPTASPTATETPTITATATLDLPATAAAATRVQQEALATLNAQATMTAESTVSVEALPTLEIRATQVVYVTMVRITSRNDVNVRKGPGQNFDVLTRAFAHSAYELLEERDGWYRISADGWVSSQVARLEQSSTNVDFDWTPYEQDFDGVTMVLVPAGCFMMGSDNGEANEKPVHEQCFDTPFWIDKYEVTQADFARLGGQKANPNAFAGNRLPVEQITWFESRDFCERRGMRLPTEAEWEYAARGPNSLAYPWGNAFIADYVVYSGNSNSQTAEVGSRPGGASWVGALDLSGNVWEWVSSEYRDYPYSDDHESNSDTSSTRVLRGGSWVYYSDNLRAAFRFVSSPNIRYGNFGFRCASS